MPDKCVFCGKNFDHSWDHVHTLMHDKNVIIHYECIPDYIKSFKIIDRLRYDDKIKKLEFRYITIYGKIK